MTTASSFPTVKKWLLCIDLKVGVLLWVSFEMMIWMFLTYAAVDNESSFLVNRDLDKFEEHMDDNWYYQMIFGTPEEDDYDYEMGYESAVDDTDGVDEEFRYQNIAINGVVMIVFVVYFILVFLYIFGIAKSAKNFLIPYLYYDFFVMWMSFILVIAGLFLVNFVLVRNCSIFVSIKIYPAICNYSLFKKMGGDFSFTREVPQLLRSSPRMFDRKEREMRDRKRKRKLEGDQHELEQLHGGQKSNKNSNTTALNDVLVVKSSN